MITERGLPVFSALNASRLASCLAELLDIAIGSGSPSPRPDRKRF
jgi:hypothetical protein